ncbi:hypothetical protein [Halomicronema sp. CCY15110]|uniref:hypothetical protein n=1 Tax=Halomicronema sp. CCY15110 TaxID=2767773 RepID=UPI001951D3FB|nr:hypothetical protein [Halomicronema sp. CCY15110]
MNAFLVKEPTELAYEREQEQREAQDEAQIEQWGWDSLELSEILKRWGIQTVLAELKAQHERENRSQLEYRILSPAYLSGGYDDPNPCSCEDLF